MPLLFQEISDTFVLASPYILFGIFLSGIMQALIRPEQITRHLGQRNFKSVWLSALAGIPIPLCSCGVIPAAISLRKNGASRGATLSFLISTPETDIDAIMLSFAFLDPLMAIFRPIAATITAIMAGLMENFWGQAEDKSVISNTPVVKEPLWARLSKGLQYALTDLLADIAPWLILGLMLAGIISYYVPASLIEQYTGQGFGSMLLMLMVGIPLYICASASTPIVASLLLKGMSPGAAFVFLLVGPATNITTIVMVWKFLGKRSAVIYLSSLIVCSLAFGLLLDYLYQLWGIDIRTTLAQASHAMGETNHIWAAIALALLMAHALYKKI